MSRKFSVNLIVSEMTATAKLIEQSEALTVTVLKIEDLRKKQIFGIEPEIIKVSKKSSDSEVVADEQPVPVDAGINVFCQVDSLNDELDRHWLLQLPMHQSVYLAGQATPEVSALLEALDATDYQSVAPNQIATHLQQDFYWGQRSSRILPMAPTRVSGQFIGEVDWQGSSALTLSGRFSPDSRQLVPAVMFPEARVIIDHFKRDFYYTNQLIKSGYWYRVTPILAIEGDVQWGLTVTFMAPQQGAKTFEITAEQPYLKVPLMANQKKDTYSFYAVTLKLSGAGSVTITGIDFTLARTSGTLLPGDQMVSLPQGDNVHTYFNQPHLDRQPRKLIVTFAGYRNFARRFEMMDIIEKIGEPFMLLTDFRAHGGAFYLNRYQTEYFEENVIKLILAKAHELGLTAQDIVVAGLSMGATAALYYGARLNAGEVFVMKPIIKLGDFTSQSTLALDEGVAWMFEARRLLTGRVDFADQEQLNELVLNAIKANQGETIFNIYALLEDQYDGGSLNQLLKLLEQRQQLGEYFWEHGRHTEKTGQAINWWLGQMDELLMEAGTA